MRNRINCQVNRELITCNTNVHVNSAHIDRTMQEHDLIYIREGNWNICQDGIRYDLDAGDVILLQAGHHHYGAEPCIGTVKTLFLHFTCSEGDMLTEKPLLDGEYFDFPVVVHCGDRLMVESYFRKIIYSYWSGDKMEKIKCSAYLVLLLAEICKAGEQKKRQGGLAEDILVLLNSNPGRFFSVEELAGQFGFSTRTISARFKAAFGEGVHAYQRKMKCQMADELMMYNQELTLKEVAQSFGFYDEYHFSKCYKSIYHYAPKSKIKKKT